jgi:hypothetical protein
MAVVLSRLGLELPAPAAEADLAPVRLALQHRGDAGVLAGRARCRGLVDGKYCDPQHEQ